MGKIGKQKIFNLFTASLFVMHLSLYIATLAFGKASQVYSSSQNLVSECFLRTKKIPVWAPGLKASLATKTPFSAKMTSNMLGVIIIVCYNY